MQGLRQKFTITNVRTGKVVNLADTGRVFYGAVVGMTRCMLDRNKRKPAVATQSAKPEKKTKRHARVGRDWPARRRSRPNIEIT